MLVFATQPPLPRPLWPLEPLTWHKRSCILNPPCFETGSWIALRFSGRGKIILVSQWIHVRFFPGRNIKIQLNLHFVATSRFCLASLGVISDLGGNGEKDSPEGSNVLPTAISCATLRRRSCDNSETRNIYSSRVLKLPRAGHSRSENRRRTQSVLIGIQWNPLILN